LANAARDCLSLPFPDNLSLASYGDLEAYLQLFLRKAKRRAQWENPEYLARREAEIRRRAAREEDDEATE
jgi:hypothetical protein